MNIILAQISMNSVHIFIGKLQLSESVNEPVVQSSIYFFILFCVYLMGY